jgi:hypothetical protein
MEISRKLFKKINLSPFLCLLSRFEVPMSHLAVLMLSQKQWSGVACHFKGFYFLHCYIQKEKRTKTAGINVKKTKEEKKKLGLHGITCCTRARYFFFGAISFGIA